MFNENENNIQPEKKSFGKLRIFLAAFSFLLIAGLLYYFVPKLLLTYKTPVVSVPEKTEEEKNREEIEKELELIKQGYVRSISGTIKEIDGDKIVIGLVDTDDKEKNYTVFIDDKTAFFKVFYLEIQNEDEAEENFENISNEEILISDKSILEKEKNISIVFFERVKLEEKSDLQVKEVYIVEDMQDNKYSQDK